MAMTFGEYEEQARTTAAYPDIGNNLIYPTLGLTGEAGEVADKVKKIIRDDGGILTEERRNAIRKELGDVLWYSAALARELGTTLEAVAQENIAKLASRRERGEIHGSGDDR